MNSIRKYSTVLKKIGLLLLTGSLFVLIHGCAAKPVFEDDCIPAEDVIQLLYEIPPDWNDMETRTEIIQKYSPFLAGKKIFIDPGHGGEDRTNKSGNIVEADINLRVAVFLWDYLQEAGAVVLMSREEDETVTLKQRIKAANDRGADIFISIHHNSTPKKEDTHTNYTAVYYHSGSDEYEFEPSSRDLAKYIQRDLSYVMGNPGSLGSFDGTISDFNLYPGEGFFVLREAEMTAVLVESAFFSNKTEEIRLGLEEFNQIEAWGIFRGIAKYFKNGIPEIHLLQEKSLLKNNNLNLILKIEDESGIDQNTITAFFDSLKTPHTFNPQENLLSIKKKGLSAGTHTLRVICANKRGNYSFPYHKQIVIK